MEEANFTTSQIYGMEGMEFVKFMEQQIGLSARHYLYKVLEMEIKALETHREKLRNHEDFGSIQNLFIAVDKKLHNKREKLKRYEKEIPREVDVTQRRCDV